MHEDGGGVRTSDELTADDLVQLAARDDVDLTLTDKEKAILLDKRRACAMRERQHGLSAMQGAQLHVFRLVRRDGQVAVECLLCNKQFDAQSGRHFLNNSLSQHVGKDREHAQLAAAPCYQWLIWIVCKCSACARPEHQYPTLATRA